jgi:hypothetical protein
MSHERSGTSRLPFGGILDRAMPGRGGHAWWRWDDPDLNRAAAMLLTHVDRILERFSDRGDVWLATIELDLEEGRFPDVFAAFFSDPTWDHTTRFSVPQIVKASSEESAETGALVCELGAGRLRQLLSINGGFRWGSALRVRKPLPWCLCRETSSTETVQTRKEGGSLIIRLIISMRQEVTAPTLAGMTARVKR